MSNFKQVVFEDGKGGLRHEEGVELMEVDELDVHVRKLVTMEYYLNQQLDIKVETLESEEKPVVNTDLKKDDRKKPHEEHQAFLTDLLDENPSINIEQALEQLTTKFDDLKAGRSAVHEFIRDNMGFTFKRAAFHSLKRNDESAILKQDMNGLR